MAITLIGMTVGTVVAGGMSLLSFGPGAGDFLSRQLNDTFQQRIANANEILNAWRHGDLSVGQRDQLLNETGFNASQIELLISATKTPLSIQEIITLWFRYKDEPGNSFGVSQNWLRNRFQTLAVNEERQKEMLEANRPVPSLDDIIRFAVRDVFEPRAVALGRLDEDLPELFVQEAAKRGLRKEDAINIWRAHWIFPSIRQMFEMFHRLHDNPNPALRFGRREMDTAFNVADIAPGMRDRLQAIAYQPIGRVDIRRFARLGVFGKGEARQNQIKRRYQELGYSPEDAQLQAEFTEQLVDRQSAIFSRAQVLKNYREGFPKQETETFAREQLGVLGLSEDEIDTLLKIEKEKQVSITTQTQVDKIREDFIEGRIFSNAGLLDRLNALPLSTGQVRGYYSDIVREKNRDVKRPSTSQADRMFQTGIIKEQEWRSIYRFNGFNKDDQDNLFDLVKREQSSVKRLPSKDDAIEFLQNGVIEEKEFRTLMGEIGYARKYIDMYLQNIGLGA